MNLKRAVATLWAALCFVGALTLLPGIGQAQDTQIKAAMDLLRSMTGELGQPKIEGTDTVAGKQVPALYFGSTKMNNNNDVVDKVVDQAGGTATIFVKSADNYVRIATNVKAADGTRAIGTILDPKGKAIQSINKDEALLWRRGHPR